jgi:hypothetical protein
MVPGPAVNMPELNDLRDEYQVDLDRVQDDMPLAQWLVITHQGEDWPTGRHCRNCHDRAPCRLYRWGCQVLTAAGWSEQDVAALEARAAGCPQSEGR